MPEPEKKEAPVEGAEADAAKETEKETKGEPAAEAEATAADVMNEAGAKDEKKENLVPESAFLGEKKGRKAAEKEVARLQKLVEEGGSGAEITQSIDAIGEKYDVKKEFLQELVTTIKATLKKETDDDVTARLKPIEERDRADKVDKAFTKAFASAMEKMPEFKAIVNPDVIKAMSLDPKNAKKTFTQIIEEAYGKAVPGKRTIETTKPGGGKEPGEVDFDKAKKDTAYFAEIMADPVLKKKYNAGMTDRLGSAL